MQIPKRFEALAPEVMSRLALLVASEEELEGFISKLNFMNELVWKLANVQEFEDTRALIDSVELHAGLVFQLAGNDRYSWFVAHTSWAEGGLNVEFNEEFDADLRQLVAGSVGVSPSENEFLLWVRKAASAGDKFLGAIDVAHELQEVLAATIALHSWSALILSIFSSQRLTRWAWR